MSATTLFMAPGTCARVTAIALEETGLPFETRLIRFMKGEHRSPEFLALNPKGKVPALIIDGAVLTENVAIITYLAARFPEAAIMPTASDAVAQAGQLADLCFCGSTLHPLVTRLRMPQMFAAPDAAASVHAMAGKAMTVQAELIEARLAAGPWWYGEAWSAMDAYLYWVFWRITGAGFDGGAYPAWTDHAARMEQRPAVQRALAREEAAAAQLEAEGLTFTPPAVPAL